MGRPFGIKLGIKDLRKNLADIDKYDSTTQNKLRDAVRTSTANIMTGAKRRARVRTGQLVKGITMSYDAEKNVGIVRARSPHAHLIEAGHKGAFIVPKRAKALTTPYGYKGKVQTKSVKAYPFMQPSVEAEKPNLIKNITEAINP